MIYKIKFIAGEKNDKFYELQPNQTLSIGRSHTNDICLKAPDVSGRHIIMRVGANGSVSTEILSSRITKHNDQQVNIGDIIEIQPNDRIQMGNDTVFVFEVLDKNTANTSDEDATVFPDEDKKTSLVIPSGSGGPTEDKTILTPNIPPNAASLIQGKNESLQSEYNDNETIAFQTRIASEDELNEIKKSFKRKHYKKVLMIALPIIIFLAVAISLYVYIRPTPEESLSWPQDKNGKDLDEFKQVAPYLAICYPNATGVSVKASGSTVDIITKIGKFQDVPFYISANSQVDLNTLKLDHQEAFDIWCEQMRDKDSTISFSADKKTIFLNVHRGAGVPMSYLSYTRRKGNDDFWGYAVFIRKAQTIHTMLFDLPFSEKWRAEKFFRSYLRNMVIYAPRRTPEHWEGTAFYRSNTDVKQDMDEADNFMKREAPVYWGRIFYLLRSALIKSALVNDTKSIEQAQNMLTELREQQTIWFNTQKLAYQYAKQNENKQSMHSIQAMCESVFSVEFQFADFRYDLIKRKDWK